MLWVPVRAMDFDPPRATFEPREPNVSRRTTSCSLWWRVDSRRPISTVIVLCRSDQSSGPFSLPDSHSFATSRFVLLAPLLSERGDTHRRNTHQARTPSGPETLRVKCRESPDS
jgi:hypothetical protein